MNHDTEAELLALGERIAAARDTFKAVRAEGKAAAIRASEARISEAAIARLLQMDRLTIRRWKGKNP